MEEPALGKLYKKEVFYEVNLEQGRNISWGASKKQDEADGELFKAHLNSALSYGNPFSSINLIGDSIYVSHSNFISRYSILED